MKNTLLPFIIVLRPYQWTKNLLVFSGLIFSVSFFNKQHLQLSIAAFGIFCLASSGVYILNDLKDIRRDMRHPEKRMRPIPAGKISILHARILMTLLIAFASYFAFMVGKSFFIILMLYFIFNISYSFGLKNVVILDAMIVAMGFLLRAVSGCVAIHVNVSPWLFICSLMLSMLLSFGKRRNELNVLRDDARIHRNSLQFYTVQLLDMILTICAAASIVTYSLYTMALETIHRFGSQRLIMTTPFVLFGVFRYLYLIYTQNKGGDPTKLLSTDLPTIINGILWVLCIVYIIYGAKILPLISI